MGWMAAHRVTGEIIEVPTDWRLLVDQIVADGGEPDAWDFEMTPVPPASRTMYLTLPLRLASWAR